MVDTNGDDKIERAEFIKAFKNANPQMYRPRAVREANRLFDLADTDLDGYISFEEWCQAGISMKPRQTQISGLDRDISKAIHSKTKIKIFQEMKRSF